MEAVLGAAPFAQRGQGSKHYKEILAAAKPRVGKPRVGSGSGFGGPGGGSRGPGGGFVTVVKVTAKPLLRRLKKKATTRTTKTTTRTTESTTRTQVRCIQVRFREYSFGTFWAPNLQKSKVFATCL